ncbi:MAG: class I tRNA ligase family protein, partial [Candidatus Kapaibacterium sp.]
MPEPLAKAYVPNAVEKRWYETWEKNHLFDANRPEQNPQDATGRRALDKPPFVIAIPPPNVTGILHMGHALTYTIQDVYT